MASESRVIGNVKLQLGAVNGKSYMISRSMEVTQKAKTISKFYTDENGQISFSVKESDKEKHKVTYVAKSKNDSPRMLSKTDIEAIINNA